MSGAPGLPRVLVLTDRTMAARAGRSLPQVVEALEGLDVGIAFREKDLARAERLDLGHRVGAAARTAGLAFVVASDLADELGADGVHLAAHDPHPATTGGWIGRSCHDAGELAAASSEALDYVTVSPVFATASKPGYGPVLGPSGLAALVAAVSLPVFALGGVEPGRVADCCRAGARGVAVMGAVMGAADPRAVAAAMVDEVAGHRTVS